MGPLVHRADRTGRGSLRGQPELDAEWDSEQTNAEVAEDFGLAPSLLLDTD
ncbi:hypothetical protein [Nocardia asteroides]|uniref:hypothetical protein n=1 Tax=Nocardia asteroides TaxID=1824 RepID=UPI001E35EAEB|nr:hypothetical protein [Nocardia asteroides]UGT63594.1 hypothetical protein LTT61_09910 [Nocardia asteroides]